MNEPRSRELRLVDRDVHIGGCRVRLSELESLLLALLIDRSPRVVTRSELLMRLWNHRTDPHVVEVTIGRLRHRLGDAGRAIVTVHRRGYCYRPDQSHQPFGGPESAT